MGSKATTSSQMCALLCLSLAQESPPNNSDTQALPCLDRRSYAQALASLDRLSGGELLLDKSCKQDKGTGGPSPELDGADKAWMVRTQSLCKNRAAKPLAVAKTGQQ
eukprot:651501-Pelagomonas_calceolata.AAC.2